MSQTKAQLLENFVTVKDFGAVGDGVADDTAAIQAALNYGATGGYTVTAAGTFKISSKVTIKGSADFSNAIFNVYSTPAIALEISTGNASNPTTILYNAVIYLPKVLSNTTKPGTGWASQGIGVRTVNTYSCQIYVGNIKNFATGLLCTSYGTGNVFNNYYLGTLENNQQNLRLEPGNTAAWVNSNTYIGGILSFYSAEGTNITGCYDINIENASNVPNNNLFINQSVEADTPQYHIRCAGSYNIFQQTRWEAAPAKLLFFGTTANNATRNMILGGYDIEALSVSYSGTTGKNNVLFGAGTEVFEMGTSSAPLRYININSSASPIRRYFEAGLNPWANGSDWSVSESAQSLQAKRAADANSRLTLDYVNGRLYVGDATAASTAYIGSLGSNTLGASASLWPLTDNNLSLGAGSYRWSVVYAGTGTINTSDERDKQDIAVLNAAEQRVAVVLKSLIKKFRFKDAVQAKGDNARIHVGVITQDVIAAFVVEGLDPMRYGIVCHDQWEAKLDEDGNETRPAGDRYGIRYEELLAFIISAL